MIVFGGVPTMSRAGDRGLLTPASCKTLKVWL